MDSVLRPSRETTRFVNASNKDAKKFNADGAESYNHADLYRPAGWTEYAGSREFLI